MKRRLPQIRKEGLTLAAGGLLLVACGALGGWYFTLDHRTSGSDEVLIGSKVPDSNELYITSPEANAFPTYLPLKTALTAYIGQATSTGKITDASVYFRDLNANQWVGVNTDHTFALASMLKVATAMAVMHYAEQNPALLTDHITLGPEVVLTSQNQEYLAPADPLKNGTPYTISQLLWHDLVESDNDAEASLEALLGPDRLTQIYQDLNMPVPTNSSTDNVNTAQQYLRLFRVLYRTTYLTPSDSQSLLELLAQSNFKDGLVAGVPVGTEVAHKFGESVVASSTDPTIPPIVELHDCGIVYYPGKPYFLCVLTRGADFPTLASVIKGVSALTWQKVSDLDK